MNANTAGRRAGALFAAACAVFLLGPFAVLFFAEGRAADIADVFGPGSKDLPRLTGLFFATCRITFFTALLASVLGVTVAVTVHRARGWRRRVLAALTPIPLLLPVEIIAIAWTHVLGKRGLAMAVWKQFTGEPQLPFTIYGEAGSVFVLALCWFPLVTMTTLVGLRALGPRDDAARLYAGPWRRFWAFDLPLLLPFVSAGTACVAWLALGDFDVPSVFLRNAYPIEIYASFQSTPQVGRALALALPLLALSAAVLILRQVCVRRDAHATVAGPWDPAQATSSGRIGAGLGAAASAILLLAVGFPAFSLLHQAGGPATYRAAMATAGGIDGEIFNTFRTASVAALLIVVLGLPYARTLLRASGWKRSALALLALVPLALPGTLHGLAWIKTLDHLPLAWGRLIQGSPYIVSVAQAARFFPFGVFLLAAALGSVHPDLTHAARASGASPLRAWLRVTLPLVYPGIVAAFAIAYAFAASELACSILLNPVGWSTLPVRMSSLLHFGKDELLASLCVIHVFVALVPYLVATIFLEKMLEVRLG
ncbi:MAG: iron ABC transporter permease [Planctomycetota bacterium]|nr:iron ABC transporter permease [Planctomycetota bacterium]